MKKPTKWEGVLDISFKNIKDDILYYDVSIAFEKKKVTFVLPRYDPMIGWIEVFGLPPQNEWVFLDNKTKPWKKTSPFDFQIDGKKFKMKETLEVFPDLKNHRRSLTLTRSIGKEVEVQLYEEDWSKMQTENKMFKRSVFKHSEGHYFVNEEMFFNPSAKILNQKQKDFIKSTKEAHGAPTLGIWLKRTTLSGKYPPLYSKLFPFWNKTTLEAKQVETIELGYEATQSHGDWYKLFEIDNEVYKVEEDNYTEKEIVYKGKKLNIKNTYRKKILKVS